MRSRSAPRALNVDTRTQSAERFSPWVRAHHNQLNYMEFFLLYVADDDFN